MKEADTSLMTALNDLFAPLSRKRVKDLGLTEEDEARYVGRLSREVEGTGAMDRVAQGKLSDSVNMSSLEYDALVQAASSTMQICTSTMRTLIDT